MDNSRIAAKRKAESNGSRAVSEILNPVHGFRGQLVRRGIRPKDHHRENLKQIKEVQRENKQLQQQQFEESQREAFKLERFKQVPSRAFNMLTLQTTQNRHQYLRKKEETIMEGENSSAPYISQKAKMKPPLPKPDSASYSLARLDKNYIQENARQVMDAVGWSDPSKEFISYTERDDYGKVPQYLLERKVELALEADQKRAAIKKQDAPDGMTVMSEEDRLRTLQSLRENGDKIVNELNMFPLTVDTFSQRQRKSLLENKLKQIDQAFVIFSRKIVYITKQ